jgi:hypothetical protein
MSCCALPAGASGGRHTAVAPEPAVTTVAEMAATVVAATMVVTVLRVNDPRVVVTARACGRHRSTRKPLAPPV